MGCIGISYLKHVKQEEKYSKRARESSENDIAGGSVQVRTCNTSWFELQILLHYFLICIQSLLVFSMKA